MYEYFQLGICVKNSFSPLLHFVQKGPADRVSTVEILEILGIDGDIPSTRPISDLVPPQFTGNQITWK